jgi:SAM-dependent methyltransferase
MLDQTGVADPSLIPPRELLHDGSASTEEFVLFGDNFLRYVLIPRARLVPTAAVLDMGCGNGGVARALTTFLTPPGRYEGVDVNANTIEWLQDHYSRHVGFGFAHADVWNKVYNPGGKLKAGEYRFPFANATFDLVLLKSVFTHMLPADLRSYMSEVARVLKPGGRSMITYFLLNEESRQLIDRGLDLHKVTHVYADDPLCRISDPDRPEAVVAHDERRIRSYYAETGCTLLELSFGDWCGRASILGHQDLVIAAKA